MSKPYFYIIEHIPSGKYYAGVRFAKNCNKNELLKEDGYQTSSKVVKDIINTEGLNSFKIRKIKEFNNKFDAMEYEVKFLQKVDAMHNDRFLNLNNAVSTTYNCKKLLKHYNVDNVFQINWVKSKIKETTLKNHGKEYYTQTDEYKNRARETSLKKYGTTHHLKNKKQAEKVANKLRGSNNYNFAGFYITPFGKFESRKDIAKNYNGHASIENWCKKENYIITNNNYNHSQYLKENYKREDIVGLKTYKDIGFYIDYIDKSKIPTKIIYPKENQLTVITPWGKFESFGKAGNSKKDEISKPTIKRFCVESDSEISFDSYYQCKYLNKNFGISIIGKTYKDIGFNYLGNKKIKIEKFKPLIKDLYITPIGEFLSAQKAAIELKTGASFINNACKNNNKIINIQSYQNSNYLKENYKKEDIVGKKKYCEIGFGYIKG